MMPEQLRYGGVLVPYTSAWTAEEGTFVANCEFALGKPALCQKSNRGAGKPLFAKPHAVRQREAIWKALCDLCGFPLKLATKVSLSHARPQAHAACPGDILQVEPLLHRECAAKCATQCPSLKRDIAAGTLTIRQVHAWRGQIAILTEEAVLEFAGQRMAGVSGHAKVQLLRWTDRDLEWLTR